jgi:hypothetical protein
MPVPEPLSPLESALLHAFRQEGVRAGESVPAGLLIRKAFGNSAPLGGVVETALLDLEFRGLIAPGPDPIGATSWALTPAGHKMANR